jgi:hypothetical protein
VVDRLASTSDQYDSVTRPKGTICYNPTHLKLLGIVTHISNIPASTTWNEKALYGTSFHGMAPYGTIWQTRHRMGVGKRYIRTHISDSLILFPKDQIISFIQLHYKASQLATLRGIL